MLLNDFNIRTICASVEANDDFVNQNNLISFENGYFPLMTFAHCPIKTIYNNTCQNCKYTQHESCHKITYFERNTLNIAFIVIAAKSKEPTIETVITTRTITDTK